jgi:hypothetical protein
METIIMIIYMNLTAAAYDRQFFTKQLLFQIKKYP